MNRIIEKIKKFFYKLKNDENLLLAENTNNADRKTSYDFKQNLDVRDEQKIIDLQRKYEIGEISDKELSPFQVLDLINLYKKQIKDLNVEISIKELK